jgi:hypothetical protein
MVQALCYKPEGRGFDSFQLFIEMSTKNLPGVKERPAREADNLTTICELIV